MPGTRMDQIGIELDEPLGTHNGTVLRRQYFRTDENRGLLASADVLTRVGISSEPKHVTYPKGHPQYDPAKHDQSFVQVLQRIGFDPWCLKTCTYKKQCRWFNYLDENDLCPLHSCPYPGCSKKKRSNELDCGTHAGDQQVRLVVNDSKQMTSEAALDDNNSPRCCVFSGGCMVNLYLDSETLLCPMHHCPFVGCGREKKEGQQDCGRHSQENDTDDDSNVLGDYRPIEPDISAKELITRDEEVSLFGWLSDER